jgi:hypothetical protein
MAIGIILLIIVIAFIALKILGVVEWNWKWIYSPLWIPLLIPVIGFFLFITAMIVLIVLTK